MTEKQQRKGSGRKEGKEKGKKQSNNNNKHKKSKHKEQDASDSRHCLLFALMRFVVSCSQQ